MQVMTMAAIITGITITVKRRARLAFLGVGRQWRRC
jgi:hypothetical protein